MRIKIWDTAGQERFRALTKIYYQDADIAILVYDITNKESFDDIKNYWVDQLKTYAPKHIGNKTFIKIPNKINLNIQKFLSYCHSGQ